MITYGEVKAAITLATSGKAAGPSGVVAEMLKPSDDKWVQWMTDLCNSIVREGKVPNDWKKVGW